MDIILPLRLAWGSLFVRKGRTVLTVLGVVIGIASVIIVLSAGESIKDLVLGQLESFGSNVIQTEVKVPNTGRNSSANATGLAQGIQITTLKISDAEAIAKLPNIKEYYAAVFGQSTISYQSQNQTVNFMGTSAGFINIGTASVAKGRFYTSDEDNGLQKVVVLGSKVATKLFPTQNPIGQYVKFGHNDFQVIGVMASQGAGFGVDYDNFVYLPVQTAQKIVMGIDYLTFIVDEVVDPATQDQTAAQIESLIRERHNITNPVDDDFAVSTMAQARDLINSVFGGITLLLVAIAAISLIVGGIGIMNIMYVSVTERTFEIGLRKAIGAKPSQILWQFLWEAVAVTVFGGIIGIILGIIFTFLVSVVAGALGFHWAFHLPINSVLIAFGFSTIIGVIFGYYPAQKAAKLNPVQALGHE